MPTVLEPSTQEPSSGCGNFVWISLSWMPYELPDWRCVTSTFLRDLVLAPFRDREVDLEKGIAVAVEDRRHAVLLEERDVLEPVDVLTRCRREQVDVLDERDVLLVREAVPGEELGVERPDLLGLGVREVVPAAGHVLAHVSTALRSATSAD